MKRTITPGESKKLFEVCKNNAVEHYDIQLEMVDHLASLIEDQWETESETEFYQALKKAIQKFGCYSFTKIRLRKEKELHRKYNRLLWQYFLEFYRWPKAISTLVFTLGLFLLFQVVEQTFWIVVSYSFGLFLATLFYHFFIFPETRIKVVPWKSFLMLDYLKNIRGTILILFQLPNISFQIFNLTGTESIDNTWILFGISFSVVALSIVLYGFFFFIPQKIQQHFMEQYSEFVK